MHTLVRLLIGIAIALLALSLAAQAGEADETCATVDWSTVTSIQPDLSLDMRLSRALYFGGDDTFMLQAEENQWRYVELDNPDSSTTLSYYIDHIDIGEFADVFALGVLDEHTNTFYSAISIRYVSGITPTGNLVRWNLDTMESEIIETDVSISSPTMSDDGHYLVYSRNYENVHVLNTETGETVYVSGGVGRFGGMPVMSQTGNRMAYLTNRGIVVVVNVETGEELTRISYPNSGAGELAFNHDGSVIMDDQSGFWDATTGEPIFSRPFEPDFEYVWDYDFHPTQNWLAIGVGDDGVHVLDSRTGELITTPPLDALTRRVWSVHFLGDSTYLAAMTTAGRLLVWELPSGEVVYNRLLRGQPMLEISSGGHYMIFRWLTLAGDGVDIWRCRSGDR